MNYRKIKVYWRKYRQISRICRWLDLSLSLDGTFKNNKYQGYKIHSGRHITFVFTKVR